MLKLEEKHRRGYLRKPPRSGEFDVWETEQKWGDESKRGDVRWYRFQKPDKIRPVLILTRDSGFIPCLGR